MYFSKEKSYPLKGFFSFININRKKNNKSTFRKRSLFATLDKVLLLKYFSGI